MPTPPGVEVRRSRRRTRTVSAWREDGRTVVAIPARFTRAQEAEWVDKMLGRLAAQDVRRRPSDALLMQRATELSRRYLEGRAVPASVEWSSRQGKRWGSCTVTDRSIRISAVLQGMPRWVLDYVLIHELAHLLHAGHGPRFWAIVAAYPHADRARGFLDGYAYARGRTQAGPGDEEPGDPGGPGDDLDPLDDEPTRGDLADDEPVQGDLADDEPARGHLADDEPAQGDRGDGKPVGAGMLADGPLPVASGRLF